MLGEAYTATKFLTTEHTEYTEKYTFMKFSLVWGCLFSIMILVFFLPVYSIAQEIEKPQENTPDPGNETSENPDSKPADFSKGFELFDKLGLPDISKGKYVKIKTSGCEPDNYYIGRLLSMDNAWLIKEDPEGLNVFMDLNGKIFKGYSQDYVDKKFNDKTPTESEQDEFISRSITWKETDLNAELKRLMEFIRKKPTDQEETGKKHFSETEDFASMITHSDMIRRDLFLYALQIYRSGKKDEPNEITAAIFDSGINRKSLMILVLSQLADNQYENIYSDFYDDKNWKNYLDGMETLLKRYNKNSWQKWNAVNRIYAEVKKKIENPSPPELTGEGITEEDKTHAKEMCSGNFFGEYYNIHYHFALNYYALEIWIWTLNINKKDGDEKDSPKISTVEKIKARGMASLPMLMKLLSDEYMTDTVMDPKYAIPYHSRSSDWTSMSKEELEEIYKSVQKPLKRSDLARILLQEVVFDPDFIAGQDGSSYRANERYTEGFEMLCSSFMEKIRGKSPIEIAKMYMEHGSDDQKEAVVNFLIENGSPEASAIVEKYFLDMAMSDRDSSSIMSSDTIDTYVIKKGKDAKSFIEKFTQKMREKYGDVIIEGKKKDENPKDENKPGEEESMYEKPQNNNIDNDIVRVRGKIELINELVKPGTFAEILGQFASGERKYMDALYSALSNQRENMKKDEVIGLVLETVLKTKDVKLRGEILHLIDYCTYTYSGIPGMENVADDKPDPKLHADLWRKLFDDSTPSNAEKPDSMTFGEEVIRLFEQIYGEKRNARVVRVSDEAPLGKKRYYSLLRARADAMFKGKTGDAIPPFPDEKNVSEQRRAEIGTALKKENPDNIQTFLDKLSNDELLALIEMVKGSKDLNEKIIPVANRITKAKSLSPDIRKKLDEFKGQILNTATVEKIANLAREMLKTEGNFDLLFTRNTGFNGFEIEYFSREHKEYEKKIPDDKEIKILSFDINGPEIKANFAESFQDKDQTLDEEDLLSMSIGYSEDDADTGMQEKKEKFWKSVEKLSSGYPSGNSVSILFYAWAVPSKTYQK